MSQGAPAPTPCRVAWRSRASEPPVGREGELRRRGSAPGRRSIGPPVRRRAASVQRPGGEPRPPVRARPTTAHGLDDLRRPAPREHVTSPAAVHVPADGTRELNHIAAGRVGARASGSPPLPNRDGRSHVPVGRDPQQARAAGVRAPDGPSARPHDRRHRDVPARSHGGRDERARRTRGPCRPSCARQSRLLAGGGQAHSAAVGTGDEFHRRLRSRRPRHSRGACQLAVGASALERRLAAASHAARRDRSPTHSTGTGRSSARSRGRRLHGATLDDRSRRSGPRAAVGPRTSAPKLEPSGSRSTSDVACASGANVSASNAASASAFIA